MSGRSIPEPHHDEFHTAFNSLRDQAGAHGLDLLNREVATFIQDEAEVKAQMMAEIRWRSSLIGPATQN